METHDDDEDEDDDDEFAGNVAHFCCTLFSAAPPPDPLLLFEPLTFIELILLVDSLRKSTHPSSSSPDEYKRSNAYIPLTSEILGRR